DEVPALALVGGVDDVLGTLGQRAAQPGDRPRGEPARDDAAQLGVLGRVLVEQDVALQLDVLARQVVGEPDDRRVLPRRVGRVVTGDLADQVVAGDRPVAVVVEAADAGLLVHPPHRRVLTQLRELGVRDPLDDDVRVGRVEPCGNIGLGHVFSLLPGVLTRSVGRRRGKPAPPYWNTFYRTLEHMPPSWGSPSGLDLAATT